MLQITALMDDRHTKRKDLIAEHGLSMLVSYAGRQILFDCGSGAGFLFNARKLGIDLRKPDAVVLSHGHYDHAGGFSFLAEENPEIRQLFTGPGFFAPKYARDGIRYTNLSAGFDRRFLEEKKITHRQVEGLAELFPGAYLISGFPRTEPMETIPERFVRLTEQGFARDDFQDELCLVLETPEGLVMLVGCAHPGIVNMVKHVRALLGKPIGAVFGGTHLVEGEEARIRMTAETLHRLGVTTLGLSHCSGERADAVLGEYEDIRSCRLGPGDSVVFL